MEEREKMINVWITVSSFTTVAENTYSGPAVSDSQLLMSGSEGEIEYWRVLI